MEDPSEIEHWKRISVLGSGAFGVVSLWKHDLTEDYIAIKKCKFKRSTHLSERQRKRWENEVDIMRILNCPNIVSFKALPKILEGALLKYNPTNLPMLSMEYCTKGNLRHVLNQVQNSTGLQERDIRVALTDIINGVSYLHKLNITHRDIKPDNIVLQECGDKRPSDVIYKLIDLGYAKELSDTIVSFVGTLHYLAPEIFKTEKYNHTVDYWSLGVLTFELICGVLPFLPQYTPVERFPYIEKKKPEDICIYQWQSGSITYSSELLKENHISTCLQRNVERWLRRALHYDPAVRGSRFPDDTDVFESLLKILEKKTVGVFSVHTLEFYSYEITESTPVGALKEWIARDTGVQQRDQVLLSNSEDQLDIADDRCVVDVVPPDEANLFVLKRGAFIHDEPPQLPASVANLFERCSTKYRWRELRPIYTKALFFLTQEEKMLLHLKTAFKLCSRFVQNLNAKLQDSMRRIHKTLSSLLIRIDCYSNLHGNCSKYTNFHEGYKKHLLHFQHLLTDLEQCIHNANKLIRKVDTQCQRQGILDKVLPNVLPVIKACDISKEVKKASEIIVRGSGNVPEMSPVEMVKVVSSALKEKDRLLNNSNFQSLGQAMLVAAQDVQTLQSWMDGFHQHCKELSKAIDDNQREQYENLLSSSTSIKSKEDGCVVDLPRKLTSLNSASNALIHWDADSVIGENQELRYQMEDALGELLATQTSFREELKYHPSYQF